MKIQKTLFTIGLSIILHGVAVGQPVVQDPKVGMPFDGLLIKGNDSPYVSILETDSGVWYRNRKANSKFLGGSILVFDGKITKVLSENEFEDGFILWQAEQNRIADEDARDGGLRKKNIEAAKLAEAKKSRLAEVNGLRSKLQSLPSHNSAPKLDVYPSSGSYPIKFAGQNMLQPFHSLEILSRDEDLIIIDRIVINGRCEPKLDLPKILRLGDKASALVDLSACGQPINAVIYSNRGTHKFNL